MEWTAKAIEELRALWDQGHSTAEIGRRMGVTKNAIVGKAHRLDLPARPSPIRKEQAVGGGPAAPRRKPSVRDTAAPARRIAPQAQLPAVSASAPRPVAAVSPFLRVSARSCCWPIGEPGSRDFRFCAAEAVQGKPYCSDHVAVAYVRVRERRSDAA